MSWNRKLRWKRPTRTSRARLAPSNSTAPDRDHCGDVGGGGAGGESADGADWQRRHTAPPLAEVPAGELLAPSSR